MATATLVRTARIVATLPLVALLVLSACGRPEGVTTVDGHLRAGDADFWLVDATLVAIGGARITGEPSQVGSRIHAQGRRTPDGILEAETITVGQAEPAGAAASLATVEVSGPLEAREPASGRWRVQGRAVIVPDGVATPSDLAIGAQVTVQGYTLPNGDLLAAEIGAARQAPTSAPTATATSDPPLPAAPAQAPTMTPVPVQPAVPAPAPSAAPAPNQPKPPPPAKPPKDDGGDGKGKDKGKH
jgi:hypothetical protein